MKLFATLKSVRALEKGHLPFVKSVVDFDIIIEVGFAEEEGQPLTLKQLFLLDISSRTTIRRRLAKLSEQGVIVRRKKKDDGRTTVLAVASPSRKQLSSYGSQVAAIWAQIAAAMK
ncbi:MAG TPA: hypothetical protein VN667_15110 [Burkholderiales bacterium]|nr:hypothetical protein [Burkholderiales bacterium]